VYGCPTNVDQAKLPSPATRVDDRRHVADFQSRPVIKAVHDLASLGHLISGLGQLPKIPNTVGQIYFRSL